RGGGGLRAGHAGAARRPRARPARLRGALQHRRWPGRVRRVPAHGAAARLEGALMKVLVTGGCGLVGSFVVRYLLHHDHQPVAFDLAQKLELLEDVPRDVVFGQADVRDVGALVRAVRDNSVQRVIHTASFLTPGSRRHTYVAVHTNIMGALNVYELPRSTDVDRVVFISTGKVRNDAPTFAE